MARQRSEIKSEPAVRIREFLGLNNRAEPRTMVPGELVTADNVDLDDRKKLRRRRGHSRLATLTNVTSMWATPDEERLFIVDDGKLYEAKGNAPALVELTDGLDTDETYFDWDGSQVFVSNGAKDVLISGELAVRFAIPQPLTPYVTVGTGDLPAGRYLVGAVLEDSIGRQSGISALIEVSVPDNSALNIEAVAQSLTARIYVSRANDTVLRRLVSGDSKFANLEQLGPVLEEVQYDAFPPGAGGPIAYWQGRVAKAYVHDNVSIITLSHPYWPHLFQLGPQDFTVQGSVTALAAVGPNLLIGTTKAIYQHNVEGLLQVADYGMPSGHNVVISPRGIAYLWTDRGFCRAFPFEPLTESVLAPYPGDKASVGIVEDAGFARLVALVRGAEDTNPDNTPRW